MPSAQDKILLGQAQLELQLGLQKGEDNDTDSVGDLDAGEVRPEVPDGEALPAKKSKSRHIRSKP